MSNPHIDVPHTDTETAIDVITLSHANAMGATLDCKAPLTVGNALPYLWHWLYFRPCVRQSSIGNDGHPEKGGFLPDLGLPRRMWAGGRLRFVAPLEIGATATRMSQVVGIQDKSGRSGRLAFVTVKHSITSGGTTAIHEEQDIVYRAAAAPGAASAMAVRADNHSLCARNSRWVVDNVRVSTSARSTKRARLPRSLRRCADQGRLAGRADPAGIRRLGPGADRGLGDHGRDQPLRRQLRRLPRPDVQHGHAAAPRLGRAEAVLPAQDRQRRTAAAVDGGDRADHRHRHHQAQDHRREEGRQSTWSTARRSGSRASSIPT
jgi:hypothetical protein